MPTAKNRFDMRTSPSRDTRGPRRFTTRGRIVLPAGSDASCRGRAVVRYKAGGQTISSRATTVRPDCRFSSSVTFRDARRFAGRSRLRVHVRFGGTAALAPVQASTFVVRVR